MMRLWDRIEQTLVGLLGLAALVVGMFQVFGRYFESTLSSGWGDEVIVYLVIWAIMIVSSQLVRYDGHVRPDVVLRLLGPGAQRVLESFNCVVALVFCGGMVWYGWQIVDSAWLLDERSFTGLSFPMYIYYAALPAGSALMFLRYAIRLARYLFYFDPATMGVGHTIHEAPTDMQLPRPGQTPGRH
ncbi:TRAP transporter small permease [Limobrevibacterium gyesilva]|uniref:TRAP transporter small permease protein n=1 Tax=Limobrevibacterium gyesilva TaxID=2991712 RepID=A0AA41YS69_9PROT|nr:TRAP transporter small permease [Limobrevibacterium gyesilva]MCW3474492.1 TRAP transporter small permease [Limobrevibacterium gyesilva]